MLKQHVFGISMFVVFVASVVGAVCVSKGSAQFWEAFWPNLFADLFVALFFAVVVARLVSSSKVYRLEVDIGVRDEGDVVRLLAFGIRNCGTELFRAEEVYYHFWIDERLKPRLVAEGNDGGSMGSESVDIKGQKYREVLGLCKAPLFAQTTIYPINVRVWLPSEVRVDGTWKFHYMFSTSYGIIPQMKIDKNGEVDSEKLSYVTVPL